MIATCACSSAHCFAYTRNDKGVRECPLRWETRSNKARVQMISAVDNDDSLLGATPSTFDHGPRELSRVASRHVLPEPLSITAIVGPKFLA